MAMTLSPLGEISVQIGNEPISTTTPAIAYDAISDELIIWLYGAPSASVVEPANDVANIMFDVDTGQAVGVQLDSFATYTLKRFPALEPLARFLGIVAREQTDLFVPQTVMEEQAMDEAEFPVVKHLIRTLIDQTGGIVEGALSDVIIET